MALSETYRVKFEVAIQVRRSGSSNFISNLQLHRRLTFVGEPINFRGIIERINLIYI
jgi:hypothetical protein